MNHLLFQFNTAMFFFFFLQYSRCLALSRPFQFSQQDIPNIRKRIYKELCDCELHEQDWWETMVHAASEGFLKRGTSLVWGLHICNNSCCSAVFMWSLFNQKCNLSKKHLWSPPEKPYSVYHGLFGFYPTVKTSGFTILISVSVIVSIDAFGWVFCDSTGNDYKVLQTTWMYFTFIWCFHLVYWVYSTHFT